MPAGLLALFIVCLLSACAHKPPSDAAAEARLQAAPLALPDIVDARARFREIYCAVAGDHGASLPDHRPCDEALVRLAGESPPSGRPVSLAHRRASFVTVIVPGLLGECIGRDLDPFADALAHVESIGFAARVQRVGGRSSSALNARLLTETLLGSGTGEPRKLVLIGHSKGAVDILEALVASPALQKRVLAVVSVAGPIRGSPLADSEDRWYVRLLENFPSASCSVSDKGGVRSVSTTERLAWLSAHPLPSGVRYFSLGAIALEDEVSSVLKPFHAELSLREPRNDGNVVYSDAVIPGATLLGYARADHFAVAVPFSRHRPLLSATLINHNPFPREVLLESILRFVEEAVAD
jgi:hypothetical protein